MHVLTANIVPMIQSADYIEINRTAYDSLADEYRARREPDRQKDTLLVRPFVRLLRQSFGNDRLRVLDVGCGNGLNLSMFADEGMEVTGIDISQRMLRVARETCPTATLIHADFLSHPFQPGSFHGVFAKASIHLFPMPDALRLLAKTYALLLPGGVFYVTTTVESAPSEGLREKTDYEGGIRRYRRMWSENDLRRAVSDSGFHIVETGYNQEPERGKIWFNIWAQRKAR